MIDASVIVDVLMQGDRGTGAAAAMIGYDVHAPALADSEALSAIARIERAGIASADQATSAVERLSSLHFDRHDTGPLIGAAWSMREAVRITDALYVALAQRLGMPLVTADRRLARAVRDQRLGEVILVE